ncbi:MAG: D-glycero-beta-D-manno-heptose 1-phosphate adenylyltransferase [Deltaproteobacteria bacterium]|nr:D-glycero-beta-D-manno-heptose 1-phosphate adenylyltransferase [Deltaproteobacteria bacterium]
MDDYRIKVKRLDDARKEVEELKSVGKKIVFTNGCFDILHVGHARYLQEAKGLGDYLIVAVNSDRSVRAIKGPKRPVVSQDERAEMLAALGFVDAVVIFDEETPLKVIECLVPDVLVKGGDWRHEDIVGGDVVLAAGGEVRSIAFVEGVSTTGIIKKISGVGS